MYRKVKPTHRTTNIANRDYEGETIEAKIRRIVNNKEPITDGAPIIYTDRKDGIMAAYDIRTDRWEIAVSAMEKVAQAKQALREQRIGERTYDTMSEEQKTKFHEKFPNSKIKPIQTTGEGGAQPIRDDKLTENYDKSQAVRTYTIL